MKKKFLLIIPMIIAMAITGCGTPAQSGSPQIGSEIRSITPAEVKAKMDMGYDFILVDVRTAEEYEERHIEGAILIPNETIETQKPDQLPDTEAEIIVYCRSGRRSREAAAKLISMGYKNVFDLGGINSWPYETAN